MAVCLGLASKELKELRSRGDRICQHKVKNTTKSMTLKQKWTQQPLLIKAGLMYQ